MPTMSSWSRFRNSVLCRSVNSPPNTRWSNCPGLGWSAMQVPSVASSPAAASGKLEVACEFEKRAVTLPSGSDQGPVHRTWTIVNRPHSIEVGQQAAGFVHQKIGRGKVPVMTVATRDGDVHAAMGDVGDAQSECADARQLYDLRVQGRNAFENALGTGELGAIEIASRRDEDRHAVAGRADARLGE